MEVFIINTKMLDETRPDTIKHDECTNEMIFENESQKKDFFKVLNFKNLIEYVMNLKKIEYNRETSSVTVDPETFNKYITVADGIDKYFSDLVDCYIDSTESDDICCSECDCDEGCHCCDCDEECDCDDETEECPCDECEAGLGMNDAIELAKILKPAFTNNDVSDESEIKVYMTGAEYNHIKSILDNYNFTDEVQ